MEVGNWLHGWQGLVRNVSLVANGLASRKHIATFYHLAPGYPGNLRFSRNQGEDPNNMTDILYGRWGHPSGKHRDPPCHTRPSRLQQTCPGCKNARKVRCRMDNKWTTIRMRHYVPHSRRVLPKRGAGCPGEGATPRPSRGQLSPSET